MTAAARNVNDALDRPLLLPNIRSFGQLFDYKGVWDHAAEPDILVAPRYIGRNELGPFCSVKLANPEGRHYHGRSLSVRARDIVIEAIEPRIVTPDDHLSFEIIEHHKTGMALVICQHGYIIGSHWLAYIDPSTIPGQETS